MEEKKKSIVKISDFYSGWDLGGLRCGNAEEKIKDNFGFTSKNLLSHICGTFDSGHGRDSKVPKRNLRERNHKSRLIYNQRLADGQEQNPSVSGQRTHPPRKRVFA
ncbi:hypothetical protein JTE90_007740 [Oedothorax gibbosus]|uniref:Uncharacterized protein n=1 Tax=Oedothorax gibbosus TaxID=931172 RepID=A0AAV6V5V7_9ARAC|nr:hypothetical protein JTE90_007740 [Oedothorax gibbosus]